jgi:hypothetical protein
MSKFFGLGLFIALFFIGNASALANDQECAEDLFDISARQLKLKNFSYKYKNGVVIAAACKASPTNPNLILSVFAYDSAIEDEKNLLVAIIDEKRNQIVSSYKGVMIQDASTQFSENSFKLDTAKYQLSEKVRAFGVRFDSAAISSCGEEGGQDQNLTLFVQDGKKLRAVFDMSMYAYRLIEGVRCGPNSDEIIEDAYLTAAVQRSSTNGFADLLLTAKIDGNRFEHHLLRYDGKRYQTGSQKPWWLGY